MSTPPATRPTPTTGRRKEAVARVFLTPGTGKITVNKRDFEEYFPTLSLQNDLLQPLVITGTRQTHDLRVTAKGGGVAGQAGAVRLGIARALIEVNPELRPALKAAGLLTRDARTKERLKPGRPGARKRFQFSKR